VARNDRRKPKSKIGGLYGFRTLTVSSE